MTEKIALIKPEIVLLITACACLLLGLAKQASTRRFAAWAAGIGLIVAAAFTWAGANEGLSFADYTKFLLIGVGLLVVVSSASLPDRLTLTADIESGKAAFDPALVIRGEFFAFILFATVGAMLCAGAGDLVWLFLALELSSLPTYVLVATSKDRTEAQEAGVKYFFLGALAAAVFLYGFTLIYGATGETDFFKIHETVVRTGTVSPMFVLGLALSILGIGFKIAAFPMHFYVADVYQGAPTPITGFLATVPKIAGFVSIILVLSLVRGFQPEVITDLIIVMAVLTMTVGNILGILQHHNVKRVLAYSSIAHSGYMLVGLVPLMTADSVGDGVASVLFYLVVYSAGTIASFAVLGTLQARGEEVQTFEDLGGLVKRRPLQAWIMLVAMLSLIGLPPLAGFVGKMFIFWNALNAEYTWLVVIALINSAISTAYYLRIGAACFFGEPASDVETNKCATGPNLAAVAAALISIALFFFGQNVIDIARSKYVARPFKSKPVGTIRHTPTPTEPAPQPPSMK